MNKFKHINFFAIICLLLFIITFLSFFTILPNKDSDDNYNDKSNNIDWSQITISCIGDSITQGHLIDTSYPEVLGEILGAKNSYNFGIGWSICSLVNNCSCHPGISNVHNAMCLRYNKIPIDSDIIIVMCGANDRKFVDLGTIDDTDITTYYGALNALCKGLKNKYKNSYIFFMTNFAYENNDIVYSDGKSKKQYYSTAIKDICAKYNLDVFDTCLELPFNQELDTVDGCHPTEEFVTNVWTPAIAQFIKDNYKQN